jgi:hypothetical protein
MRDQRSPREMHIWLDTLRMAIVSVYARAQ